MLKKEKKIPKNHNHKKNQQQKNKNQSTPQSTFQYFPS